MPHRPVSPQQRDNARRLRRDMTDVERKVWLALRGHRFQGVAFRRQVPIGPHIVDFACHQARLVIELDGSQHGEAPNLVRDRFRDDFIAREGYRVLRFWNHEINAEFAAVMDRIYLTLIEQGLPLEPSGLAPEATPLPTSPTRGEGTVWREGAAQVPSPLVGEGQGGG